MVDIQQAVLRSVAADKVLDTGVVGYFDQLYRVASDESVLHHHHRQQKIRVLSDPHRLNRIVIGFLAGLGKEVNPSRITSTHRIRVIAVDVQRS